MVYIIKGISNARRYYLETPESINGISYINKYRKSIKIPNRVSFLGILMLTSKGNVVLLHINISVYRNIVGILKSIHSI